MLMPRSASHRRMLQSRVHALQIRQCQLLIPQHTGSTITTCKGSTFPTATFLSRHPQHTMTRFQCIESQCGIQRCARPNTGSLQANKLAGSLVDSISDTGYTRILLSPRHCNRQQILQQTIDGTGRRSPNATIEQNCRWELLHVAVSSVFCKLFAPQMQNWLLHRCSTVQCRPLHRLTPVCHPAALLLILPLCSCTNSLSWSA